MTGVDKVRIALLAASATLLLIGAGFVIFVLNPREQVTAEQARHAAHDAQRGLDALAASRKRSILVQCQQGNRRNRRSIATLDQIIAQIIRKHPKQAASLHQSRDYNVTLINALDPRFNCRRRVRVLTRPPLNPPVYVPPVPR